MRRWRVPLAAVLFPFCLSAQARGGDAGGPSLYRRTVAEDGSPRWIGEAGADSIEYGDGASEVYRGDLDGDGIEDRILDLGACGNWGYCVHAILLGRDDGRWALAMDPDYVYEFQVEPSAGGGPPTLWELARGAMAGRDDLGRYRWEYRDGLFRRTSRYELIQLMRDFGEPKIAPVRLRRLAGGPGAFIPGGPYLAEAAGAKVYRAAEDGRLGVVCRVAGHWVAIEETAPPVPPLDPAWIAVSRGDADGRTIRIDVLAADGGARRIILALEGGIRWESYREDE